jgi:predicted RNA-binding Zn ribbon-like protein
VSAQPQFFRYEDSGVVMAVGLVNGLTLGHASGRPVPPTDPLPAIRQVLDIDPPSAHRLRRRDVPAFVTLATQLRSVFDDLDHGDVDTAADRLNSLLAAHPAHPHLAKDDGRWRIHHHPADAALVPMVTAICAEGLARSIGDDDGGRLGTCADHGCDRVFVDRSKNASRRFCSTTCQNRVKAAAHRRRRAASDT